MPAIYHSQLNQSTKIGVWHITETENFFLDTIQPQRNITHPHKRLQHLAGRNLLSTLFPSFPISLIQVADTRKPFLQNEAYHFSISHCGDFAAAIVSTKNRVGVDIEIPHPKIEKIQHKFLSIYEQQILLQQNLTTQARLTMAWSIKEAVFKWYGAGQVDFIQHIIIKKITQHTLGFCANCIFTKNEPVHLQVENINVADNNLSWVVS